MKQMLIILSMCIASVNVLNAQEKKPSKANNSTTTNNSDKAFMDKAAESGMAEVMFGKLAQTQANSQKVKDYGMMMEKDHTKANQELLDLAIQQNITLPTALPSTMQADFDAIKKKVGKDFDKAFMDQMIADHQKAIELFEAEAKNGKNEQVRTWAQNILPKLKQHIEHAKEVKNSLK